MKSPSDHFETAVATIPAALLDLSGKVFYSGRGAFLAEPALYILGANPGGDPDSHAGETVRSHTGWVASTAPTDWSAYRDESWKGKPPGRHGMQPRILHALNRLSLNPGVVPASNLVFIRSRRESSLAGDFCSLALQCWPFHEYIIWSMRPKVILCLGATAGEFVRERVGAHRETGTFTEQNGRRWQSHAYASANGPTVVVATHPSIADWRAPATDPTGLLVYAMHGI